MKGILVEKCLSECPLCGELHHIDKKTRIATAKIKGKRTEYLEEYFVCENCEEGENEFIPAKLMDANLLRARDAYRTSLGMLTSNDIVSLRAKYGLTQRELAKLLGWGEATISRYETKQIQDETYDGILQKVSQSPLEVKQFLIKNKCNFDLERYYELLSIVDEEVKCSGEDYFTRQILESNYLEFQAKPNLTGGVLLNIDKVCCMVNYFASSCSNLFKVKLMKLLWYADALFFKEHGRSMSGLVYMHMPRGALPVGHYELIKLIPHEEVMSYDFEFSSYKILPGDQCDESVFTKEELSVLNRVVKQFGNYSGKELAEYMHKEIAYTQTTDHEIIPYSLAAKISL